MDCYFSCYHRSFFSKKSSELKEAYNQCDIRPKIWTDECGKADQDLDLFLTKNYCPPLWYHSKSSKESQGLLLKLKLQFSQKVSLPLLTDMGISNCTFDTQNWVEPMEFLPPCGSMIEYSPCCVLIMTWLWTTQVYLAPFLPSSWSMLVNLKLPRST